MVKIRNTSAGYKIYFGQRLWSALIYPTYAAAEDALHLAGHEAVGRSTAQKSADRAYLNAIEIQYDA